jgi:hypothetical protein
MSIRGVLKGFLEGWKAYDESARTQAATKYTEAVTEKNRPPTEAEKNAPRSDQGGTVIKIKTGTTEPDETKTSSTKPVEPVKTTDTSKGDDLSGGSSQDTMQGSAGSDDLSATSGRRLKYRDAIASIESGGRYNAMGPRTRTGDRAYGKYQMMGNNIPAWTKAALGQSLSPDEFLRDPKAQDATFDHIFGGYVDKYGEENAAQAWFGGPGSIGKGGRKDQLGTSVNSYGKRFMSALNSKGSGGGSITDDDLGGGDSGAADSGDQRVAAGVLPELMDSGSGSSDDGSGYAPTPSIEMPEVAQQELRPFEIAGVTGDWAQDPTRFAAGGAIPDPLTGETGGGSSGGNNDAFGWGNLLSTSGQTPASNPNMAALGGMGDFGQPGGFASANYGGGTSPQTSWFNRDAADATAAQNAATRANYTAAQEGGINAYNQNALTEQTNRAQANANLAYKQRLEAAEARRIEKAARDKAAADAKAKADADAKAKADAAARAKAAADAKARADAAARAKAAADAAAKAKAGEKPAEFWPKYGVVTRLGGQQDSSYRGTSPQGRDKGGREEAAFKNLVYGKYKQGQDLTPEEAMFGLRRGWLQPNPPQPPAAWQTPIYRHAAGGVIPDPDQAFTASFAKGGSTSLFDGYFTKRQPKATNRDERFKQLLAIEERSGGRGGHATDSARDRAARRLAREEGRPSSTAYKPGGGKVAPRGGGGVDVAVPLPKARPDTDTTSSIDKAPLATKPDNVGAGRVLPNTPRPDNVGAGRVLPNTPRPDNVGAGPTTPLATKPDNVGAGRVLPNTLRPDNVGAGPAISVTPGDPTRPSEAGPVIPEPTTPAPVEQPAATAPATATTAEPQFPPLDPASARREEVARQRAEEAAAAAAAQKQKDEANRFTSPEWRRLNDERVAAGQPPLPQPGSERPANVGNAPAVPLPPLRRPETAPELEPQDTGASFETSPSTDIVPPAYTSPPNAGVPVEQGVVSEAAPPAIPEESITPAVEVAPTTPPDADLAALSQRDKRFIDTIRKELAAGRPVAQVIKMLETSGIPKIYWPKGALGFEKGGAIPDPDGGSIWSGVDPEAAGRGQTVKRGQDLAPTPKLMESVRAAIGDGMRGLKSEYAGGDGAMPTPDDPALRAQNVQRMASHEGAATDEEVAQIDQRIDPDNQLSESQRAMARFANIRDFYAERGDKAGAEAAAASMLMYGAKQLEQIGGLAAGAYTKYQETGNPKDLDAVAALMEKGYNMIPNGADVDITVDPQTRTLLVNKVNADGETEQFELQPNEITGMLESALRGNLYWSELVKQGDPKGYESRLTSERQAADDARARREWDRQHGITRGEELTDAEREAKAAAEKEERTRKAAQEEWDRQHGVVRGETLTDAEREAKAKIEEEKRAAAEHDRQALFAAGIENEQALRNEAFKLMEAGRKPPEDKLDPAAFDAATIKAKAAKKLYDESKSEEDKAVLDAYVAEAYRVSGHDAAKLRDLGFELEDTDLSAEAPPFPGWTKQFSKKYGVEVWASPDGKQMVAPETAPTPEPVS